MHLYEVRPRKDKRGVNLISDALPFGRLWNAGPNAVPNAIGYAMHRSRSHHAVIRVYNDAGNVIETHEHKGAISKSVSVERDKEPPTRLSHDGSLAQIRLLRLQLGGPPWQIS